MDERTNVAVSDDESATAYSRTSMNSMNPKGSNLEKAVIKALSGEIPGTCCLVASPTTVIITARIGQHNALKVSPRFKVGISLAAKARCHRSGPTITLKLAIIRNP